MKLIRIKGAKNIYYLEDDQIADYLTDGVLDIDSEIYKKANKKRALKSFSLQVRVTKVVDGKQKYKRKKIIFGIDDNLTIRKALNKIAEDGEVKKLLDQIKTDAQVKKIQAEEAVQHAKADQEEKSSRILDDVWDEFYDHKVDGTDSELGMWRPSTARTYKSFYSKWINNTDLGNTPIKEISKEQCDMLITSVKKERSLRTASTVIEVLKPVFDWYFEKYDINQKNPVPKKKKKVWDLKNERIIDISLLQVKRLYSVIDHYDDELFRKVFLWLRTGRRRGEIISLRMDAIDIEDKTFMIEAENNKADEDMVYALRPELEATLIKVTDPKDYLFESLVKKGQPIHVDTVTKHWKKIIAKTGGTFKLNGKRVPIDNLHLHDLRHIISGVLKRAEVPEEVRGKVLGHKRTSITDRYGVEYYGDIDKAFQLFLDIVYGVVPEDTKWGTR